MKVGNVNGYVYAAFVANLRKQNKTRVKAFQLCKISFVGVFRKDNYVVAVLYCRNAFSHCFAQSSVSVGRNEVKPLVKQVGYGACNKAKSACFAQRPMFFLVVVHFALVFVQFSQAGIHLRRPPKTNGKISIVFQTHRGVCAFVIAQNNSAVFGFFAEKNKFRLLVSYGSQLFYSAKPPRSCLFEFLLLFHKSIISRFAENCKFFCCDLLLCFDTTKDKLSHCFTNVLRSTKYNHKRSILCRSGNGALQKRCVLDTANRKPVAKLGVTKAFFCSINCISTKVRFWEKREQELAAKLGIIT